MSLGSRIKLAGVATVALYAVIFVLLIYWITAAHAQQQISLVKQFPDGTYLITVDGQEHWAVNLAKTKEIKQAENDAKAFKAELDLCHINLQKSKDNTQDERVRAGNIKRDYDDQTKLLTSCMALSGNGPKWSKNWLLDLGLKIAPTVTSAVRCN